MSAPGVSGTGRPHPHLDVGQRLLLAALCALLAPRTAVVHASDDVMLARYDQGTEISRIEANEARGQGLTAVDLSDQFVPGVLTEDATVGPASAPPYAATYRALANERFDQQPQSRRARDERYLELYGIFPSFRILRQRLLDETRHACHEQLDLGALRGYSGRLAPDSAHRSSLGHARRAAVLALQGVLRCEQLLAASHQPGVFDFATSRALQAFQRKNMIVAFAELDTSTRTALLTRSRERDFMALLRGLRERVAAATGLIEDGSALSEQGSVVGRLLDGAELRQADAAGPLPGGAPDLLGRATDVAARALGWTSETAAQASLQRLDDSSFAQLRVALRLPVLPSYHTQHMSLRVEIDRGDVWYEVPYGPEGFRRAFPIERRPTLILYAQVDGEDVPLVRWNTTIGGFQPERRADQQVVLRYKGSEPGPRVWRSVIAAPTWLPPESTPDADLVRKVGPDSYAIKKEVIGPGFDSAYGLVMMRHELVWYEKGSELPQYQDRGVRTHGSVSYRSILQGESHGCHRLFNHLALRLAAFLVTHRKRVRVGMLPTSYSRLIRHANVRKLLTISDRGYGYELTPPVPVEVLEGRIMGHRKQPVLGDLPLPKSLVLE